MRIEDAEICLGSAHSNEITSALRLPVYIYMRALAAFKNYLIGNAMGARQL